MFSIFNKSGLKLQVVGCLGDKHHPFCHPDYLKFVLDTGERFGVTRWIDQGDEWDHCALSDFPHDPEGLSPGDEYKAALEASQAWYKAIPKLDLLESNHGIRPFKKAKRAGLPRFYMKTYKEFMKAPPGWNWHKRLIVNGVLHIHGEPHIGSQAATNAAKANRMSVAIGHVHSFGGVQYSRTYKDEIFGLNCGCGINEKTYAFDYAGQNPTRASLGMGIIIGGKEAFYVPMG